MNKKAFNPFTPSDSKAEEIIKRHSALPKHKTPVVSADTYKKLEAILKNKRGKPDVPKGVDINLSDIAMGAGGGLLAHSIASAILGNQSEEEKRKQSTWMKAIRALMPIAASAAGSYAGIRLGRMLKTSADTGPTLEEARREYKRGLESDADTLNSQGWKKMIQAGMYGIGGPSLGLWQAVSGAKQWYDSSRFLRDLEQQQANWDDMYGRNAVKMENTVKGLENGVKDGTIPSSALDRAKTVLENERAHLQKQQDMGGIPPRPSIAKGRDTSIVPKVTKGVVRSSTGPGKISKLVKLRTGGGILGSIMSGLMGWASYNNADRYFRAAEAAKGRADRL